MSIPLPAVTPCPERILTPANGPGLRWLAGLHSDPASCLDAWAANRLAAIPLGKFNVLRVGAEYALRVLNALRTDGLAPVLHDSEAATVDFLTAPGTAVHIRPGVGELLQHGVIGCPAPGRCVARPAPTHVSPERVGGARAVSWLVEPDASGALWDLARIVRVIYSLQAGSEDSRYGAQSWRRTRQPRQPLSDFFDAARAVASSRDLR
ncbi:hypothetical protein ACFXKJ_22235 [Kitasatospora indigofera]|uniref:hypothetical protein n=1 Tax=Kitasatospora indigofera TaxID=67307 RepID=UPI0036BE3727